MPGRPPPLTQQYPVPVPFGNVINMNVVYFSRYILITKQIRLIDSQKSYNY